MTEYTVTFQKNQRVGTRSFHMEYVDAESATDASKKAQAAFPCFKERGYRVVKITHFEWAEDANGPFERLTEDF